MWKAKIVEKLLESLKIEMSPYFFMMGQAIDTVIDQDISNYPILILHQTSIPVGIKIISHEESNSPWSVHISTLEEFYTKQLIADDRLETFKKRYKSPQKFLCLFVISEFGATFVFIPR